MSKISKFVTFLSLFLVYGSILKIEYLLFFPKKNIPKRRRRAKNLTNHPRTYNHIHIDFLRQYSKATFKHLNATLPQRKKKSALMQKVTQKILLKGGYLGTVV